MQVLVEEEIIEECAEWAARPRSRRVKAPLPAFSPFVLSSLAARARWTMDDIPWNEEWAPYLPAHIHRPGEHQVSVYVRINLGARRESSEYSGLACSSNFRGDRLGMIVDAPGDVNALRRYMLYMMGDHLNGLAETDLRVLLGGRALEGDFPVGKYAFDKTTVFEMGLAAELAPEQACHNRRVESQARRKFMVRIPDIMRSPARRLRGSQQMGSASGAACRLAARKTVSSSLFSRGEVGPMTWWSTPATCSGNFARARARATIQSVAI